MICPTSLLLWAFRQGLCTLVPSQYNKIDLGRFLKSSSLSFFKVTSMSTFSAKLSLSLVAFLIAACVMEFGLRLIWENPYHRTHTAKVIDLRLLTPLMDRKLNRAWLDPGDPFVDFRTNERGYILPVDQFDEPDLTIAFLGGSTTECRYVRPELRFSAMVSDLLLAQGVSVNILNAARSGNTTHDTINNYFNHVVLDKPDIVVMMHAINDHGLLAKDPSYLTRSGEVVTTSRQIKWFLLNLSTRSHIFGLLREVEYWAFSSLYAVSMLSRNRQVEMVTSSAEALVATEPFADRLKVFVAMVQSFGAQPVLMTQPIAEVTTELTPEWVDSLNQKRFNEAIRAVAASMNVPLVDLEQRLEEHADFTANPLTYFYDGIHVTDTGSQIYAREIVATLTPLIQEMSQKADHDH
ncbi:SGNH/GDSL hydrolase family protein [Desulfonatronum sp. SC1]|uniref:SGNH/GDSL hydrolase family protein n=1 Tax=Desulfonatronum sp. SC1 TaxID=2109626 RepID=UPI001304E267|nr:SGNH/GDSL hydrolase family protein [Desulfonatronum sp. SC1]